MADFLNNLKETKLKIYKSVFVSAVVSSELFRQKGGCWESENAVSAGPSYQPGQSSLAELLSGPSYQPGYCSLAELL